MDVLATGIVETPEKQLCSSAGSLRKTVAIIPHMAARVCYGFHTSTVNYVTAVTGDLKAASIRIPSKS
jgi:hypothetical protein